MPRVTQEGVRHADLGVKVARPGTKHTFERRLVQESGSHDDVIVHRQPAKHPAKVPLMLRSLTAIPAQAPDTKKVILQHHAAMDRGDKPSSVNDLLVCFLKVSRRRKNKRARAR